jgi:hypothetical protein
MRKWFGRLHGGQLLILASVALAVGFGLVWVGYVAYLKPSNFSYSHAYSSLDSAAQEAWLAQAKQQATESLWLIGTGLLISSLTLPMLWWWLDARRRNPSL